MRFFHSVADILSFFTKLNKPTVDHQPLNEEFSDTSQTKYEALGTGETTKGRKSENPKSHEKKRQVAPLYLMELKSGGNLLAKNIVRTEKTIAYEDGKGLITTINRADILKIKKLQ